MRVGVPVERKPGERRVALLPDAVRELVATGHDVLIETGAGKGAGVEDDSYARVGAELCPPGRDVYDRAELVVKVKEPQPEERRWLRRDHILFAYLHLAADSAQARDLMEQGATCVAFESVTGERVRYPLLAPMSRIAGRLAIQAGARSLESHSGGAGKLLGGVAGVPPCKVVIIGGGMVGRNAATMAIGLGASVTILDKDLEVLDGLDQLFGPKARTVYATAESTAREVATSDLVIGAVLVPGARAPKVVSEANIGSMSAGSVFVDVAIDQGGCSETSRPTTHADPTYVVNGVVHYCVANMPGAVPATASQALNAAILPYVQEIAAGGLGAVLADPHLRPALTVWNGHVTDAVVASELAVEHLPIDAVAREPDRSPNTSGEGLSVAGSGPGGASTSNASTVMRS